MTMLSTIQNFCKRTNLPVPNTVVGTTDTQILQIMALLEEVGNDMASRTAWEGLTIEASLTTTATESQGAITTIASNGYRYMKNGTIWSRTRRLPVCGPLDAQEWQQLKAMFVNGPYYRYRMRGGELLVNPTPPAGEDWYFEYVTKFWILGADGTTYKEFFTLDTDTILIPESVLLMGLRAWWKKEKGFDYAEDMRMYESQLKDSSGRDGSKKVLSQDGALARGPVPGVWVSPGTWPL